VRMLPFRDGRVEAAGPQVDHAVGSVPPRMSLSDLLPKMNTFCSLSETAGGNSGSRGGVVPVKASSACDPCGSWLMIGGKIDVLCGRSFGMLHTLHPYTKPVNRFYGT